MVPPIAWQISKDDIVQVLIEARRYNEHLNGHDRALIKPCKTNPPLFMG
jgi:hypothetical protein